MDINWLLWVSNALFGVILYLFKTKEIAQNELIATLFKKHDEDAGRLQQLEVTIAREYYVKGELDPMFAKMEHAFRDGFNSLAVKFDHLSEKLITQLQREPPR